MTDYKVEQIKPDTRFNSDVVVDLLFLVATPPCAVTESILKNLQKWGFEDVWSEDEKTLAKLQEKQPDTEQPKTQDTPKKESSPKSQGTTEDVDLSEFVGDDDSFSEDIPSTAKEPPSPPKPQAKPPVRQATPARPAATPKPAPKMIPQDFNPFAGEEEENAITKAEDKRKIQDAQQVYQKFMEFINAVYTRFATQKVIAVNEVKSKALELCNFVRENKKFILRIAPAFEMQNRNFLVSHAMRSAVLSIVIGLQIKMPYDRLIELAMAAILHEIGQIRLPPQLYLNNKPLTASEKAQMQTHTVIGYNIAKNSGLPITVQLGILDHHERENGSGYPRRLSGNSISLYGKIIAVACSFEAITAPRQFKAARTSFEGMVELLKNSNHLYDDVVVKALLYSISLYPIGAFVFLSNGRVAQVVDVVPTAPKNPIVQIVGSINPDGTPKRIKTNNNSIKIVRTMTREESADLRKSLGDNL